MNLFNYLKQLFCGSENDCSELKEENKNLREILKDIQRGKVL